MTGSTALDIVIGLVFIYLLYSLFATVIQEIIATNLAFRSKILEKAIIRMLNDETKKSGFQNLVNRLGSILALLFKRTNSDLTKGSLADHFYKSPLIKYLAQDHWHSKPSYLTAANFSKTIIDILRGNDPKPGQDFRPKIQDSLDNGLMININPNGGPPIPVLKSDSDTLQFLRSLWADSQGDIEKFKAYLEKWFDDTMERASGWYKQYTQVVLLFIGLGIAAIFNVDTLQIIDKLSNNPKLTAQLVQQADNFVKAHPNFDEELNRLREKKSADADSLKAHRDFLFLKTKEFLNKDLKNVNDLMGLGWVEAGKCNSGWLWLGYSPKGNSPWYLSLFGWLLTALAISLGAPFWFDLLNKLMKLRSSIQTETAKPLVKDSKTQPLG